MRGKVDMPKDKGYKDGITPAYAGKRLIPESRNWIRRDHPCVCGEKLLSVRLFLCFTGSPLRMRGKVCGSQGNLG